MPGSTPRPFQSQGLAQRRLRPKASWTFGGQWQTPQAFTNSGATSVTLDFTNAPVGEWCFAFVSLGDSQAVAPTAPGGWSILLQGAESASGAASSRLIVYTRLKQGGDTTQAFTWGTACGVAAIGMVWYGLDQVTPTEGAAYLAHSSGTTYPTASITPTAANRWIVSAHFNRTSTSTGTWISDNAMTERWAVATTANPWSLLEIADTGVAVTAAAHTYTSTSSVSSSHGGSIVFALIPATPAVASLGVEPLVVTPTFAWPPQPGAQLFGPGAPSVVVAATSTPQPLVVTPLTIAPQVPIPVPGAQISASQPLGNPAVGSPQPLVVTPPASATQIPGARLYGVAGVAVTPGPLVVTPPFRAVPVPGAQLTANAAAPAVVFTATPQPLIVTPPFTPVPTPAVTLSASRPLGNPAVGTQSPLVVGPPFAVVPVPGARLFGPGAPAAVVSTVATPQPLVVGQPYAPVVIPAVSITASQPLGNPATGSPQPLIVTPTFTLSPVPGAKVFAAPAAPVIVATATTPGPLVVGPPWQPVLIPGARITTSFPLGNPAVGTRSPLVVTPPWRPVVMPRAYLFAAPPIAVVVTDCQTHRPTTGTTARPGTGTTTYALSTTSRPVSGITSRPDTGLTDDPC